MKKTAYLPNPVVFIAATVIFSLPFLSSGCATGDAVYETDEHEQGDGHEHGEHAPSPMESFAQCLTQKGVTMYGAFWCPHCQNQKEMFGESWQFVNYVECALPGGMGQAKACADAGIKGYPTWVFGDGTMSAGELTLEDLSQKSGCEVGK